MEVIVNQLHTISGEGLALSNLEQAIHAWHRQNESSRRLETIPGIGPITALVLAATVTSPSAFSSGRQFAAWLGLVPRQNLKDGRPVNTTPADCRSSRGLALGQNNGSDPNQNIEHYAHNP
ncbi:transposase [Mesorhizobium sp. LSJC264A00]|uniref:transposase n=2 Tax=unclassified Mesorhizobium TaxID=325217 RepID=UPI0018DDC3BC|nr:transposase [Mesorhizobium sp. LSJC264A00]